jgi:hypothetical protein
MQNTKIYEAAQITELINLVDSILYITPKSKKENSSDYDSLSFLVEKKLTQSESIKLGISLETFFRNLILAKGNIKYLFDINLKNMRLVSVIKSSQYIGKKDHLYVNHDKKHVIYFKPKSNLNFDSEKLKAMINNTKKTFNDLKEFFPEYQIDWYIFGMRYFDKYEISYKIKNKYKDIYDNIICVNELLKMLDIDLNISRKNYQNMVKHILSRIQND